MQEDTMPPFSDQPPVVDTPTGADDSASFAATPPTPPALPLVPTEPISVPPPPQVTRATRFWGRFLGCLGVFMLIGIIFAGIGGAVAFDLIRQPPVTSDTMQRFAVGRAPRVVVQSSAGNLHFVTGTGDSITVQTHKMAWALTHDAALKLLNAMQATITQSGDTVTITDSSNDTWHWLSVSEEQIDFTITLPAHSAINATQSAGNLDVTGVTGQMNIQESAGNVQLHAVILTGNSLIHESAGNIDITGTMAPGATLDLHNSAGNITYDGALATGNTLSIHESAGNVTLTLPQATSARIDAHVSAGSLTINGWPISVTTNAADASASGNTQPSDSNPSDAITVQNSAGNITIAAK